MIYELLHIGAIAAISTNDHSEGLQSVSAVGNNVVTCFQPGNSVYKVSICELYFWTNCLGNHFVFYKSPASK